MAWPGLVWAGLGWPGLAREAPGGSWTLEVKIHIIAVLFRIDFLKGWPGLGWPGLAWLGLGQPGLAWPGGAQMEPWRPLEARSEDSQISCPHQNRFFAGLAWPGLAWPGLGFQEAQFI